MKIDAEEAQPIFSNLAAHPGEESVPAQNDNFCKHNCVKIGTGLVQANFIDLGDPRLFFCILYLSCD